MLDIIEDVLSNHMKHPIEFLRLDGSTPTPERQLLIDEFTGNAVSCLTLCIVLA